MAEEAANQQDKCKLREEGFESGSCMVGYEGERIDRACKVTLPSLPEP